LGGDINDDLDSNYWAMLFGGANSLRAFDANELLAGETKGLKMIVLNNPLIA
jgi:hypothetical protein